MPDPEYLPMGLERALVLCRLKGFELKGLIGLQSGDDFMVKKPLACLFVIIYTEHEKIKSNNERITRCR